MKKLVISLALIMGFNAYAQEVKTNKYIDRACAKILATPNFQVESVYFDEFYKLEELANVPEEEIASYEFIKINYDFFESLLKLSVQLGTQKPIDVCRGSFDWFLSFFENKTQ